MTFTDDNDVFMNAMEDSQALEDLNYTESWPKSETALLIWVVAIAMVGMAIFIYLMKQHIVPSS